MFKLFRPEASSLRPDRSHANTAEFRGNTLEGDHFALRPERNSEGQAQRLFGWHDSSQGGARVDTTSEHLAAVTHAFDTP